MPLHSWKCPQCGKERSLFAPLQATLARRLAGRAASDLKVLCPECHAPMQYGFGELALWRFKPGFGPSQTYARKIDRDRKREKRHIYDRYKETKENEAHEADIARRGPKTFVGGPPSSD